MSWPMVSIVWVNYNSMRVMSVVLRSLKSILELDYPEYEIVVVDNNSVDGSFDRIKEFIGSLDEASRSKVKLLRLTVNKGYAGGVTEGFRVRDRGSRYVIAMNNDVVVVPETLKTLVEIAELGERVGAVNCVLLNYERPSVIDSTGGILNELLTPESLFSGWSIDEYKVKKPYPTSFADGPLVLYNVKAVLEANNGLEILYDPWIIAYYDDVLLSLKLWNKGYKCLSCPKVVGWHGRSLTFKRLSTTALYLNTRNRVVLNEIANSRFKVLIRTLMIKRVLRYPKVKLARALMLGLRFGSSMRRSGLKLNLYKAPLALISKKEGLEALLGSLGSVNARIKSRFEKRLLRSYS